MWDINTYRLTDKMDSLKQIFINTGIPQNGTLFSAQDWNIYEPHFVNIPHQVDILYVVKRAIKRSRSREHIWPRALIRSIFISRLGLRLARDTEIGSVFGGSRSPNAFASERDPPAVRPELSGDDAKGERRGWYDKESIGIWGSGRQTETEKWRKKISNNGERSK